MEQYISKDALVAEIDRRIKTNILLQQKREMSDLQEELQRKIDCLKSIRGYILNTLEVKEVDLEEEIRKWQQKHFEGIGYILDGSGGWIGRTSILDIAKHFFELGLKVNRKEELYETD